MFKAPRRQNPAEIELIKKAIDITGKGFARVADSPNPASPSTKSRPEFSMNSLRNRRLTSPTTPIIATGKGACVLHYVQNDRPAKKANSSSSMSPPPTATTTLISLAPSPSPANSPSGRTGL